MALEWTVRVALTCLVAMALAPRMQASLRSRLLSHSESVEQGTQAALAPIADVMPLAAEPFLTTRLPHAEPLPPIRVSPALYARLTGAED